ncbi:MAG TPA: SRPBCC domain-containing protein [Cytophagaceae bacterium]
MDEKQKVIGLTKDAGWQFGLRKTFPYSLGHLWDFIFSKKGLETWLGDLKEELALRERYKTRQGIEGTVTVFEPYSHIRLTWKMENWTNVSTVQVRVIGNQEKATLVFHHDRLLDSDQREEVKAYWNSKMDAISKAVKGFRGF